MTRIPGTFKDKGHLSRKAVAWPIAIVVWPVHALCHLAERLGTVVDRYVDRLYQWSHPCLYHQNPPKRQP